MFSPKNGRNFSKVAGFTMANEAYELTLSGILAGQFVQNVLHVNVNNVSVINPYTEAEDILGSLDSVIDFFTVWCNALPADYRITSARCRRVLADGGPTAIMLAGSMATSVGARTGSIQAAQVNPVLVWLTTLRPNLPGKTFMPGLSETDCDDMVYTLGLTQKFDLLIAAIVAGFTLAGSGDAASFGIFRRVLGASDDIMAGRISPLVGTQRRRLRPV
jgi:hypothetical protein